MNNTPYYLRRYTSRRLYDPKEKTYITLAGVCDLIRQGYRLVVTDTSTRQDMTLTVLLAALSSLQNHLRSEVLTIESMIREHAPLTRPLES